MIPEIQTLCSVDGCSKARVAKGFCMSHYQKNRKVTCTENDGLTDTGNTAAPPMEPAEAELFVPPYPGFERLLNGNRDRRDFAKFTANTYAELLHKQPEHLNRDKIEAEIERAARIAEMDDKQLHAHELYEANPLNKLDQDERLHCIRTLPVTIVKKLFPHL